MAAFRKPDGSVLNFAGGDHPWTLISVLDGEHSIQRGIFGFLEPLDSRQLLTVSKEVYTAVRRFRWMCDGILGGCDANELVFHQCKCNNCVCEKCCEQTSAGIIICGVAGERNGCFASFEPCENCSEWTDELDLERCERRVNTSSWRDSEQCVNMSCKKCLKIDDYFDFDIDARVVKKYCSSCWDDISYKRTGALYLRGKNDPDRRSHIWRNIILSTSFRDNFLDSEYPISLLWDTEEVEEIEWYYIECSFRSAAFSTMRWRCQAYSPGWFDLTYNSSSLFALFMCNFDDREDDDDVCSCCSIENKKEDEEVKDNEKDEVVKNGSDVQVDEENVLTNE
jgi:hypothetical protein